MAKVSKTFKIKNGLIGGMVNTLDKMMCVLYKSQTAILSVVIPVP